MWSNDLSFTTIIGVLTDQAAGDYTTETIYDDSDPAQIETLADTQLHRDVDLELVRADKEGNTIKHVQKLWLITS